MSARTIEGTSARKAGWVIILLLVAWIAFLFAPFPSKGKPVLRHFWPGGDKAQTKLEAAGLDNNPDWEGLLDYFAIWADSIEWKDDKALFAYWNPGSGSYSYFFEATRQAGAYRFRSVSIQEVVRIANDYYGTEEGGEITEAAERKRESKTHPFLFFGRWSALPTMRLPSRVGGGDPPAKPQPRVDVDLKVEPLRAPENSRPEIKANEPGK